MVGIGKEADLKLGGSRINKYRALLRRSRTDFTLNID